MARRLLDDESVMGVKRAGKPVFGKRSACLDRFFAVQQLTHARPSAESLHESLDVISLPMSPLEQAAKTLFPREQPAFEHSGDSRRMRQEVEHPRRPRTVLTDNENGRRSQLSEWSIDAHTSARASGSALRLTSDTVSSQHAAETGIVPMSTTERSRRVTRILVLTNMFPPHHHGGYELACADAVDRWRARGHDVSVLTTTFRVEGIEDPDNERESGVRRDLDFYFRKHRIVRPPPLRRLRIERQNQKALVKALDETRAEVVSVWHMGAMSFGLLETVRSRRIPLVSVIGDLWPLYGPGADAWLSVFVKRPILGRWARRLTGLPTALPDLDDAGAFCFASEWLRRLVTTNSPWKPRRSAVVYHGINRRDFPPRPPDGRPWRWRLACVGRLDERKGIHVAVSALRHLPEEATLAIWGRGDPAYLARLRAVAAEVGVEDRVEFGEAPRSALGELYAGADVFLFPILWDEPFGLVPLEAMSCGTPVVATATGGSAEFLMHRGNCLVVPRDKDRALADAVIELARDPVLRKHLVAGGGVTAGLFDADKTADALEEWHLAAAARFHDGVPPQQPNAHTELRRRGVVELVAGRQD
jgi:glycosyltransferase involved in cell wall biosynthesis